MRPGSTTTWSSRVGALVIAFAAGMALLILGASSASAHDYLVSSKPADGSVVRSQPGSLSLTFDDLVLNSAAIVNIVQVTGPDGRHYESGCPKVLDRTITVPVGLGPAGSYVVRWRIVSADGHPVTQNIHFAYQPGDSVAKQTGTHVSRCANTTTNTSPAASKAVGAEQQVSTPTPTAALLATGAIILLAVGALFVLFRRRPPVTEVAHTDSFDDD